MLRLIAPCPSRRPAVRQQKTRPSQGRAVTRGTTPLARPDDRTASLPDYGGHRTGLPEGSFNRSARGRLSARRTRRLTPVPARSGVLGRPTPPRQRLCCVCIVTRSRDRRDKPGAQCAQRNRNNGPLLRQENSQIASGQLASSPRSRRITMPATMRLGDAWRREVLCCEHSLVLGLRDLHGIPTGACRQFRCNIVARSVRGLRRSPLRPRHLLDD